MLISLPLRVLVMVLVFLYISTYILYMSLWIWPLVLSTLVFRTCLIVGGLPPWLSNKECASECRRCRFNPRVWKISWRRAWQPTPVFLHGEFHGQKSLVGYSPSSRKELDMLSTEDTTHHYYYYYKYYVEIGRQRFKLCSTILKSHEENQQIMFHN